MGVGWLCLLVWFGSTVEAEDRSVEPTGVVRVASALGPAADGLIARLAAERLPHVIVQTESVAPERLRDRLYGGGATCDLLLGAPVELLASSTARKRLLPHQPAWARTLPPSCRDRRGFWHALWLEPLVIAYSRAGVVGDLGVRSLPRDYDDLGAPRWQGQVTLPEPVPYTVGAFLVLSLMERAQRQQGDPGQALRALSEIDANLPARDSGVPDYARRVADSVRRLLDPQRPEVLGIVPLSTVRNPACREELGWIGPSSGTLAWPRCVALLAPPEPASTVPSAAAAALVDMLGETAVVTRVAAVMDAVPARQLATRPGLSGPTWRFDVGGEGGGDLYPTDSLAVAREGPSWLARFENEVRGQVRSRYATFDAAFEWLGLVVLAAVVGFIFLKTGRGPAAE